MKKLSLLTMVSAVCLSTIAQATDGEIGEIQVHNQYSSATEMFIQFNWQPEFVDACMVTFKNADYPYETFTQALATPPAASHGNTTLRRVVAPLSQGAAAKAKTVQVECPKVAGGTARQSVRLPAPPRIDLSNVSAVDGELTGSLYVEGNSSHTTCADESGSLVWGNPALLSDEFAEYGNFYSAYIPVDGTIVDNKAGTNQVRFTCVAQGGETGVYFELETEGGVVTPAAIYNFYR